MAYLAIFLTAFLASLALTPLAQRWGVRWGIVAVPGGRRRHRGRLSRLGGVPILGGFLLGVGLIYLLMPPAGMDRFLLRGVLIGFVIVFIGGLVDDWRELSPVWQLGLQLTAALIAISFDIIVGRFTIPLLDEARDIPTILAFIFTIFWVMGMLNTVNFLDGLDGLASGVGAIAALMFAWHSYQLGQYEVAAFPLALTGALLGFLPFNFAPARIFLGSAGAFALGYGLATLSILAPAKIATALLVLAVPILDVAWQIVTRLRRGQSPFRGDRGHLHFRLSDGGLPTRTIVIGYYLLAALFGLVALFAPREAKLIILLLLTAVVSVIFIFLIRRQSR